MRQPNTVRSRLRARLELLRPCALGLLFIAASSSAQPAGPPPSGRLVAWGIRVIPHLQHPAAFTNIAAALDHSLALKNDGSVIAWGNNCFGQATVPPGLRNVTAIAAGAGGHNLALKSDGTVIAWGATNCGQATIPSGLADIAAVAAGRLYSLALRRNGTVVAWGCNFYGQLQPPPGLTNITAIAAGAHHCLALKSDGTVLAWGPASPTPPLSPTTANPPFPPA